MTPKIVYAKGKSEDAYLVDFEKVVNVTKFDSKGTRWTTPRFLQAVQIRHLCAGEVMVENGDFFPRPAQMEGPAGALELEHFPPGHRKLTDHAARVLLTLPLIESSMKWSRGNTIKMGKTAISKGFNDWRFLTAWIWSRWENMRMMDPKSWTLDDRWLDMKNNLKYPHKVEAFRKMCADMELFVTESRKKR